MKLLTCLCFFVLFFAACQSRPDHTEEHVFYTQDSLYKITFNKPLELDTFYSWKDEDDNPCSDEHKYRFSKKAFQIEKETGFFHMTYVDSAYRITLKHIEEYACTDKMDSEQMDSAKAYMEKVLHKYNQQGSPVDTIYARDVQVDSRRYIYCGYRYQEYKHSYPSEVVKAITETDGHMLVFTAECRAATCGGFKERMEEVFKTIRIERYKKNNKHEN